MATAMRVRDVERALLRAECVVAARSGPHAKMDVPMRPAQRERAQAQGDLARRRPEHDRSDGMSAGGVAPVTSYSVTAKRWKRGWELHIAGEGVTQSRSLAEAEGMVRDYISLMRGVPDGSFDVEITPEVGGGLDQAVREARDAVRDAEASRMVAARLQAAGLTGRDIATVLGVSAQRVSQLLRETRSTANNEVLRSS